MVDSSKDVLNYALTASVVILTVLIAWILVYVIRIFREVQRVIRDMTKAVARLNEVIDYTREKVKTASAVVPIIMKAGEKVIDMIRNARDRSSDTDEVGGESQKQKTKKNPRR